MSVNNLTIARSGYPRSLGLGRVAAGFIRIVMMALELSDTARQRRRLLELDDHLLKDIGLSRADVELEYSKSFWSLTD
jgi:uncharacterized protein YjiS (DUF1127 family)